MILKNLVTYPSLAVDAIDESSVQRYQKLPSVFQRFLASTNGAMSTDGYFRIFGIGPQAAIDSVAWNALETWKFAWPPRVGDFWCFGETAWGDQYAFKIDDNYERVFFLDAISMQPEIIAVSFEEFYKSEFLRNAALPYDELTKEARRRFGSLDGSEHLIQSPSILISRVEDINQVQKVPSVDAMILNGDLFTQIGEEEQARRLKGIETFIDASGRTRVRVQWI